MARLVRFTVSWASDYNDWLEVLELDESSDTKEEIKKRLAEAVAETFIEDMQWVTAEDIEVELPTGATD